MRAILYGLSAVVLVLSSLSMALLVRFAPNVLLFVVVGGLLSSLISGAWVILGATAGTWPRPRTGRVLIVAGLLSTGYNLLDGRWLAAGWSLLVLLAGIGFAVQIFPLRRRKPERPGAVRPPLGRRASL